MSGTIKVCNLFGNCTYDLCSLRGFVTSVHGILSGFQGDFPSASVCWCPLNLSLFFITLQCMDYICNAMNSNACYNIWVTYFQYGQGCLDIDKVCLRTPCGVR